MYMGDMIFKNLTKKGHFLTVPSFKYLLNHYANDL